MVGGLARAAQLRTDSNRALEMGLIRLLSGPKIKGSQGSSPGEVLRQADRNYEGFVVHGSPKTVSWVGLSDGFRGF